jgi:hypothetical protein
MAPSRLIAPLLALLIATPAFAGTRATYSDATQGAPLVIEVADNGDARISGGEDEDYGLLLGGHFYIVGKQDGAVKVARIEDVAAALDQVMPPVFKDVFKGGALPPHKAFRAEKKGARTVAGQEGTIYAIYGLNPEKPAEANEYVLSAAPALKPVGIAMEQYMNAGIVPAAPMIGQGAIDIMTDTRSIFALGTPLDVGRFKLVTLESYTVPAEELALPATPATVDQLVTEMKRARIDAPPPAK